MDCVYWVDFVQQNHHMAGWRVGAVASHPDLLAIITKFKSNVDSGMFLPHSTSCHHGFGLGRRGQHRSMPFMKKKGSGPKLLSMLGCEVKTSGTGLFVWAKNTLILWKWWVTEWLGFAAHAYFYHTRQCFERKGTPYVRLSLCSPVADFETGWQVAPRMPQGGCTQIHMHHNTPYMKIVIAGLGLIGGSVALALKRQINVQLKVEINDAHAQKAIELGLVDQIITWMRPCHGQMSSCWPCPSTP